MPKVPVDYSNTCIYKLVHFDDLNDENIYIGHTTNMVKRRWEHNSGCNKPDNKRYNLKVYQFIRENGGWNNWQMILIEKYPCDDVDQARARERYWKRELNATLNTYEPGRTNKEYSQDNKEKIKEYRKQWHQDNRDKMIQKMKQNYENKKEEINEKRKENYQNNRDEILEKRKEKIKCDLCGLELTKCHLKKHQRSTNCKNNNVCTN